MIVLLTADRYVAICRPMHAAQYSTVPPLRSAVAVVCVLAVAYNLPRFFERTIERRLELKTRHISLPDFPDNNVSVHLANSTKYGYFLQDLLWNITWEYRDALQSTAMRDNRVYYVVYKMCLYFIVRFLLPFAALAFFNQRLVRALRESDQLRRQSAAGSGSTRGCWSGRRRIRRLSAADSRRTRLRHTTP